MPATKKPPSRRLINSNIIPFDALPQEQVADVPIRSIEGQDASGSVPGDTTQNAPASNGVRMVPGTQTPYRDTVSGIPLPNYDPLQSLPDASGYDPGQAPVYDQKGENDRYKRSFIPAGVLAALSIFGGGGSRALSPGLALLGGAREGARDSAQGDYNREAQAYQSKANLGAKRYEADTKRIGSVNDSITDTNRIREQEYAARIRQAEAGDATFNNAALRAEVDKGKHEDFATKEKRLTAGLKVKSALGLLNNPRLAQGSQAAIAKALQEAGGVDNLPPEILDSMSPQAKARLALIERGQDINAYEKHLDRQARKDIADNANKRMEKIAGDHDQAAKAIAVGHDNVRLKIAAAKSKGLNEGNSYEFKNGTLHYRAANAALQRKEMLFKAQQGTEKDRARLFGQTSGFVDTGDPTGLNKNGQEQLARIEASSKAYDVQIQALQDEHDKEIASANDWFTRAEDRIEGKKPITQTLNGSGMLDKLLPQNGAGGISPLPSGSTSFIDQSVPINPSPIIGNERAKPAHKSSPSAASSKSVPTPHKPIVKKGSKGATPYKVY